MYLFIELFAALSSTKNQSFLKYSVLLFSRIQVEKNVNVEQKQNITKKTFTAKNLLTFRSIILTKTNQFQKFPSHRNQSSDLQCK